MRGSRAGPPLWADFSTNGTAQYHYDLGTEMWRSAEELGKPKRTLAAIERDMTSYICGAPGFDPNKLLEEYREAKSEEEALGHG